MRPEANRLQNQKAEHQAGRMPARIIMQQTIGLKPMAQAKDRLVHPTENRVLPRQKLVVRKNDK